MKHLKIYRKQKKNIYTDNIDNELKGDLVN